MAENSIIVRTIFGSHLYGTANNNSDMDFKGIFMPSKEQIYLGRIPKCLIQNTKKGNCKNTNKDIDIELYSLHYFIHLACEGETVALDMLHAPDIMILESSEIWKYIVSERDRFYTKNLKAFVGYARRQASKYGIKGSRLNDAKRVIDYCNNIMPEERLKSVWEQLPEGEHIFKHGEDVNGVRMYEVCGRKTGETSTVGYLLSTVNNFYKNYGARAEQAARNEGIDWKAVSHALRAAYQVRQVFLEGTITFPLKEASYLRQVKEGCLNYQNEVAPMLDNLMYEIEDLSLKSELPLNVNRKFWDDFIISIIEEVFHDDIHGRNDESIVRLCR